MPYTEMQELTIYVAYNHIDDAIRLVSQFKGEGLIKFCLWRIISNQLPINQVKLVKSALNIAIATVYKKIKAYEN